MPNTKIGSYYRNRGGRQTLHNHPLVTGTGLVGVEIELENIGNTRMESDYWEVKQDGSLRNNGREFVFRGPTGGRDLFNAVVELDTFLHDKNPDGNWRCSTHVHVDVRDMTVRQLKNMILAYLMYEKVLFRLSGMHRYHNNFCCAIGFAQQQLEVLFNAWDSQNIGNFFDKVLRGWDKYSALNILPVSNFGSVEFRLSEPVWRKGKLLLLCNRYLALKEFAMTWGGTDWELIDYLSKANPREILGKGCPKDLPKEIEDDLQVGVKLCHDLVTFSENRVVPVFHTGHNGAMVQNAWGSGDCPNHLDRVPFGIHNDGSPAVRGGVAANIRRFLKDRCSENGMFLPDLLSRLLNYSALRWYGDMFGVGVEAFIPGEEYELYKQWLDAGQPLQPVPNHNPWDDIQPAPQPVQEGLIEDDGVDDDGDVNDW